MADKHQQLWTAYAFFGPETEQSRPTTAPPQPTKQPSQQPDSLNTPPRPQAQNVAFPSLHSELPQRPQVLFSPLCSLARLLRHAQETKLRPHSISELRTAPLASNSLQLLNPLNDPINPPPPPKPTKSPKTMTEGLGFRVLGLGFKALA